MTLSQISTKGKDHDDDVDDDGGGKYAADQVQWEKTTMSIME